MSTPSLTATGYQERFLIVSGRKIKSIPSNRIAYFVADGRYVRLVTKNNEKHLLDYSLDAIGQRVDPQLFFRVNRQFIIGYDAIDEMILWSRSRIKIEMLPASENEIISSLNKTVEFRRWLDR
ncbi:LytR/AlgR family response regulator transcription factor [Flavobacterium wongokense]|uniref:LytR/AlgR family response regulator transcription factor n=1 Tax=Flavobacterium wongokense TaxID=2910674 RepID=UPI001F461B1D|nr:LytTR family DNA-binding domain-containing protein [Flavobacterium sp. WG47]MCF6132776.1 LytTR family transcriptional regulator [Flavobacterium sp. WG47]